MSEKNKSQFLSFPDEQSPIGRWHTPTWQQYKWLHALRETAFYPPLPPALYIQPPVRLLEMKVERIGGEETNKKKNDCN